MRISYSLSCFVLRISFITSTIQAYKTNLWTCQASISHFLCQESVCERERGKKKQRLIINEGGSSAWQSGTERTLSFSFCFRISKFLSFFITVLWQTWGDGLCWNERVCELSYHYFLYWKHTLLVLRILEKRVALYLSMDKKKFWPLGWKEWIFFRENLHALICGVLWTHRVLDSFPIFIDRHILFIYPATRFSIFIFGTSLLQHVTSLSEFNSHEMEKLPKLNGDVPLKGKVWDFGKWSSDVVNGNEYLLGEKILSHNW